MIVLIKSKKPLFSPHRKFCRKKIANMGPPYLANNFWIRYILMPSHRFHPKSSRFFCEGGGARFGLPCTYYLTSCSGACIYLEWKHIFWFLHWFFWQMHQIIVWNLSRFRSRRIGRTASPRWYTNIAYFQWVTRIFEWMN